MRQTALLEFDYMDVSNDSAENSVLFDVSLDLLQFFVEYATCNVRAIIDCDQQQELFLSPAI